MGKLMNEYDSLRNEIISIEERRRNVWIYMYVLFVTIFILGIEFSYSLLLVTYIILLPFQVVINRYSWGVTKISAFIRIFYEEDNDDLTWEGMHVLSDYRELIKKYNKSISGIIRYTGVSQLGFLATAFYISHLLYDRYSEGLFYLRAIDIVLISISVILFFISIILNQENNKSYRDELDPLIKKYKDSLNPKQ